METAVPEVEDLDTRPGAPEDELPPGADEDDGRPVLEVGIVATEDAPEAYPALLLPAGPRCWDAAWARAAASFSRSRI